MEMLGTLRVNLATRDGTRYPAGAEHAGTRCLGMEILGDGRDFQVQSLMAPLSLPATRRRSLV